MQKLKQLYAYFILQRWHLHSIALPLGFLYSFLCNYANFLHLKTAYLEGIVGTEWIFQTFFSFLLGYGGAWLFESWQSYRYNVNKKPSDWKKNSVPDIWFTGSVFLLGHIIYLIVFEF